MNERELSDASYLFEEALSRRFEGAQPLTTRIRDVPGTIGRAALDNLFYSPTKGLLSVANYLRRHNHYVTNTESRNGNEVVLAIERNASTAVTDQLNRSQITHEPIVTMNNPNFNTGFVVIETQPFNNPFSTGYAIILGTTRRGEWHFKDVPVGLVIVHNDVDFP